MQVGFEDPAHQGLGQSGTVQVIEQPPQRADQVRAEHLRGADAVQDERPALWQFQRLAEQLPEVMHTHALLAERLGERVVLLLCLPRP